jgi:hypothetical protein
MSLAEWKSPAPKRRMLEHKPLKRRETEKTIAWIKSLVVEEPAPWCLARECFIDERR